MKAGLLRYNITPDNYGEFTRSHGGFKGYVYNNYCLSIILGNVCSYIIVIAHSKTNYVFGYYGYSYHGCDAVPSYYNDNTVLIVMAICA